VQTQISPPGHPRQQQKSPFGRSVTGQGRRRRTAASRRLSSAAATPVLPRRVTQRVGCPGHAPVDLPPHL